MNLKSDLIFLSEKESNAAFIGIRHVDILKIKGLEFHHLFLILLIRDPSKLINYFPNRIHLFYDMETKTYSEKDVIYYSNKGDKSEAVIWETTISASSECGYDPKAKMLGNLINVPNFDRKSKKSIGKMVFSKKIGSNDLKIIRGILEFERKYNDSTMKKVA